jgi:hypothetical protein
LPRRAIESGSPFPTASPPREGLIALSVIVSTKRVSSGAECGAVDFETIATPSFIVTARGWAPPMPPKTAVKVIVPFKLPPKSFLRPKPAFSYVP